MPETTARLNLPLIQPSQAQKHVTHNEALLVVDNLAQMVLAETGLLTPPAAPLAGHGYSVGVGASGAWATQDGNLAFWQSGAWAFVTPQEGWCAWDVSTEQLLAYTATGWQVIGQDLQELNGVGIGTTSDATNKLSVASDATLLSHDGAGHQLKINKATAGDTASLLFQSAWAGHAEMGLTGDNDFHIKVSPDGTTWTDALTMNASSGHVTGSAVQASATDTTAGRLARADWAYSPGNLVGTVAQTGGTPTGAVIERGSNANGDYVRFADGTQMCFLTGAEFTQLGADSLRFFWTFPMPFNGGGEPMITPSFSPQNADFENCWITHIGICRNGLGLQSTNIDLARVHGAPAFTASTKVKDVRLVAHGRWF